MRRKDFLEYCDDIEDLMRVCDEYDISHITCNVWNDSAVGEKIDEDIIECIRTELWTELRDMLNNIDDGAGYYIRNDILDYDVCTDDDYERMKNEFLSEYNFDSDEEFYICDYEIGDTVYHKGEPLEITMVHKNILRPKEQSYIIAKGFPGVILYHTDIDEAPIFDVATDEEFDNLFDGGNDEI